jgi:hypothetical protein
MKPRRDSGAVRVSPIMSEVRIGWAVMISSGFVRIWFQQARLLNANHAAARIRSKTVRSGVWLQFSDKNKAACGGV